MIMYNIYYLSSEWETFEFMTLWAGHAMLQMADGKQNNQDICQGIVKDAHFDDKF